MRTVDVDARRYAWCRGQAMWRMGLPIVALVEDIDGALEAGQDRLVRHTARQIGLNCAVVLNLALNYGRPLPPTRMRASWALERLCQDAAEAGAAATTPTGPSSGGPTLGERCAALVRGERDAAPADLAREAKALVADVRAVVGEIPDPLTPEGYFPALALAREWLRLAEALGEEGFLPREWTGGA